MKSDLDGKGRPTLSVALCERFFPFPKKTDETSSERRLLTCVSHTRRSPASQPPSPQTAVPTVIP